MVAHEIDYGLCYRGEDFVFIAIVASDFVVYFFSLLVPVAECQVEGRFIDGLEIDDLPDGALGTFAKEFINDVFFVG